MFVLRECLVKSTNNFVKNLAWARKGLFSFSYVPLDFITVLALVMVIFSGLGILIEIVVRFTFPALAPSGFTTLIILILFMGGIQLLCLAIIGSYLAHIYDEVKRRPSYLVEEIVNDPRINKDVNRNNE